MSIYGKENLSTIIESNIDNILKEDTDINSLLHRCRGLLSPQELCEIETLDDAKQALERLFQRH